MFQVLIKNGVSDHHDYDNCALHIADIPSDNIPRVGDTLKISYNDRGREDYLYGKEFLVREVNRSYVFIDGKLSEFVSIYVMKI